MLIKFVGVLNSLVLMFRQILELLFRMLYWICMNHYLVSVALALQIDVGDVVLIIFFVKTLWIIIQLESDDGANHPHFHRSITKFVTV